MCAKKFIAGFGLLQNSVSLLSLALCSFSADLTLFSDGDPDTIGSTSPHVLGDETLTAAAEHSSEALNFLIITS